MRFALVHELPLELYPPTQNLVDFLLRESDSNITVYTSFNHKNRVPYQNSRAQVIRLGSKTPKYNSLYRKVSRLFWHFRVASLCASLAPESLLYIEPHSALAPYLYYKWFLGKAKLFVHHHEYYSPADYRQPSNKTIRFFHRLETSYLFPKANWISQTNPKRLELFSADHPTVARNKLQVLPNLPPANWSKVSNQAWSDSGQERPLKLVYVGSVSLTDTHIEAVIRWVKQKPQQDVTLDVYAYQVDARTALFLKENSGPNIRFHSEGIAYSDIPNMLSNYHVGLILYKGNTVNFQHNATNKLFEYLACGLDVWYADGLKGVEPYRTSGTYPQVLPVPFQNLSDAGNTPNTCRDQLSHQPWQGSCEEEFARLLTAMRG